MQRELSSGNEVRREEEVDTVGEEPCNFKAGALSSSPPPPQVKSLFPRLPLVLVITHTSE